MDQNRLSRLGPISNGDHSLRDRIDRHQLNSLIAILIGLSQLLLVVTVSVQSLLFFVVGAGGWLLIGIGVNGYLGREVFQGGWDSERAKWVSTIVAFIVAVAVAAAAVLLSFT